MAADISENVATTLTVQYADKIDLILDAAVDTLSRSIAEYTARGWSEELIVETITTNLTNPNNPIFGPVLTQLKTQWQGITAKQRALNQALVWKDTTIYRWVCLMTSTSCMSCVARHNQKGTMEQWVEWGLPGDEWSGGGPLCGTNCRCYLLPEHLDDNSVNNPIVIGSDEDFTREQWLEKMMSRPSAKVDEVNKMLAAMGAPSITAQVK